MCGEFKKGELNGKERGRKEDFRSHGLVRAWRRGVIASDLWLRQRKNQLA